MLRDIRIFLPRKSWDLGLKVLWELVGYTPNESLIDAAGVAFLAEDPCKTTEKVVTPVKVSLVLRVSDNTLKNL